MVGVDSRHHLPFETHCRTGLQGPEPCFSEEGGVCRRLCTVNDLDRDLLEWHVIWLVLQDYPLQEQL